MNYVLSHGSTEQVRSNEKRESKRDERRDISKIYNPKSCGGIGIDAACNVVE